MTLPQALWQRFFMNPRLLKTFLAVVLHRNFTRAADDVHLAQSSVSDQIQSLEAELGASLFIRAKSGLELTPAGEALRPYAEEMLALGEEARAAIADATATSGGAVTIGALETIASARLATLLSGFRNEHPEIDLRLTIAGSGELMGRLERGQIDVATCFHDGALDERFVKRTVLEEPLVLIGAPDRRNTAEPIDLTELSTRTFVATAPGCAYRAMLDKAFAQAGIGAPRLAAEVESIDTIAKLVASGAGLGLVPRLAVFEALARGEVSELGWPGPEQAVSLTMIWRRRRVQPPALRKLLAAAVDHFQALRSAGVRLPRAAPSLS